MLVAVVLLVAGPGLAAPITETLFYAGPGGYGVAEADAMGSGLPILSPPLEPIDGFGVQQDLDPRSIDLLPTGRATSDWTVTNQRGEDLIGDVFLLFVRPLEREIDLGYGTATVSYDPTDVGLTLTRDTGGLDWVLLEGFDPVLGNLYYPAVSLGSLLDGASSEAFEVNYVLENPEIFLTSRAFYELGLPKWQVGTAFIPIPEPSAGLLVATGLFAFGLARRRRA